MENNNQQLTPQDFFDARRRRNQAMGRPDAFIGTGGGQGGNQNIVQAGTIDASRLENAQRFNIPQQPQPQVASSIINSVDVPTEEASIQRANTGVMNAQEFSNLAEAINQRSEIFDELGMSDIRESFAKLQSKGDFTSQLEDELGLDDKTIAVNDINNRILKTDNRFTREREAIEDQAGLTAAQKNAKLNDVSRKQARELADLSIMKSTALNDFNTAQALVDRKVELEFEPVEQALEFQKFVFDQNKELFNQEETRQFDAKIRKEQEQVEKDKFKFQQLENTKLSIMQEAKTFGASNEIIANIQNAKNPEEAFNAAGSYFGKEKRMDMALKQAQLAKTQAEREKVVESLMSSSGSGNLSREDRESILKDQTSRQATALIAVRESMTQYNKKLDDLSNGRIDRKELNAFVTNVVAPSLAVANGQGAMTDDERKGIIDDIGVGAIKKQKNVDARVSSVIDGVDSKIGTFLDAIDSAYPSASTEFGVFSSYNNSLKDEKYGSTPKQRVNSLSEEQIRLVANIADMYEVTADEILMDNELFEELFINTEQ